MNSEQENKISDREPRKRWNDSRGEDIKKRSRSVDVKRYNSGYDSDEYSFSNRRYYAARGGDRGADFSGAIGDRESIYSRNSDFSILMIEREHEKTKNELEKTKEHKSKLIEELRNKIRESKKNKKKIIECTNYYNEKVSKLEEEKKNLSYMFEKKINKYDKKIEENIQINTVLKKKNDELLALSTAQRDFLNKKEKTEKNLLKSIKKSEEDIKYATQKKEKMENLVRDMAEKISSLQKIKECGSTVDFEMNIRKEYETTFETLTKEKNDVFEKYKTLVVNSNRNIEYLNTLAGKTKELHDENIKLKSRMKELTYTVGQLNLSIDQLKTEKTNIEMNLSSRVRNNEKQIEELESSKISNILEISSLKEINETIKKNNINSLKQKEEDLRADFSFQITNAKDKYNSEKENYTREFTLKLDELNNKKNKEIETIKENHKNEIDRINKNHEIEMVRLNRQQII